MKFITRLLVTLFAFTALPAQLLAQGVVSPARYTDAMAISAAGALPTLLPVFDRAGVAKTPAHVVVDKCTLSVGVCTVTLTGSAVFTSATSYTCLPTDQALAATLASASNVSGTSFTIYGTLTDVIQYSCTGY